MDDLLTFLKLLADPTRLNLLGILAQEPRSVDELAAMLGVSAPTVSHHLKRLHKAGLVAAKAEQYYSFYALEPATFQRYAALLTPEHLVQRVQTAATLDYDAYIDQILARWIKADRLQGLPTQVQHRRIVLAWLVDKFAPDLRYAPRQVDDVLAYWCNVADPHTLALTAVSRALVDAQLLARTRDGRWYWRTDSPLVQAVDAFSPDLLPVADTTAIHAPFTVSPLLALVRVAMRIKAGQPYAAAEMDGLIQRYQKEIAGDPATLRAVLVAEGLLQQQADDTYIRPSLPPDHPVLVKVRAEALARQGAVQDQT
ncbi:MAG: metalloregulator ArsR/SmtB family transcription factor [Caldilineaceae bacterium]